MTQSTDDDLTITISNELSKEIYSAIDNSIVIDLNNCDVAATTSYDWNSNISGISVTSISGDTYTLNSDTITFDNIFAVNDNTIDPEEIEKMCRHYPGLEKVWRNFKSVYDMVKQDYEGKKKAGELDDDIPF